jgi:hypothetical protein
VILLSYAESECKTMLYEKMVKSKKTFTNLIRSLGSTRERVFPMRFR